VAKVAESGQGSTPLNAILQSRFYFVFSNSNFKWRDNIFTTWHHVNHWMKQNKLSTMKWLEMEPTLLGWKWWLLVDGLPLKLSSMIQNSPLEEIGPIWFHYLTAWKSASIALLKWWSRGCLIILMWMLSVTWFEP
jgi:hypothetical protein